MPLYFAYGSNMDVEAMRQRCPRSAPLGPARLDGHSFFISADGYASVRPRAGDVVHGLGWQLALRDVAALDRYESVETGLYRKCLLPIQLGPRRCSALVYVGRSTAPGEPVAGYVEAVIAAAERLQLPAGHLTAIRRWASTGRTPGGSRRVGAFPRSADQGR